MTEHKKTHQDLSREELEGRITELERQIETHWAVSSELSLFKAIVEASCDAIAISDADGRLVYINPAHERLFGRPLEEARGLDYRAYYPPDAVDLLDREVTPTLQDGWSWEGVLDAFDAAGNRFPLWERADTVRDEEGAMRYGFGIMHDARDGVDGKRTEAALKEIEQRYRTIFEQNLNPIGIIDTAGRYLDANPAFLDLVETSKEDLLRMRVFDFSPPGKTATQEQTHIPAWNSGGTVETKYWINGRIKIVELTITPVQYRGRDAVIGVGKDITERKRVEESIRLEHARFAAVIDALDAPVYAADMETHELLFMNQFAREERGDWVGKKCWQILQNGQDGPCPFCTNDKLLDADGRPKGVYVWEFRNTIDGRCYQCRDQAIPWPDGRFVRLEIAIDITERKFAEQALIESRERLLEAQRLANIGHWTWDVEGGILDWSEQVYHIFGVDPDAFHVGVEAFEAMIHPDDRAAFLAHREDILANRNMAEIDHRIVRPSGEIRFVRELIQDISDDGGRIQSIIGTVQDITDHKNAEAVRSELVTQKQRLQKAESLSRMAGAIAHHFNNQLSVVMGNLEMVLVDLPDDSENRENLFQAFEAGRKAAEKSMQMLIYLGHMSGSQKNTINLSDFCRQSLALLGASLPNGVTLKVDFPDSGTFVHADAGQIQQVLTNLFTNAQESLPDNHGTIGLFIQTVSHEDISTSNRFPLDWQPQNTPYTCLEIADTGCGISDEDVLKIFDPFYTTKFTGRGMGLPVTMGILKAHGGCITVENERECGCVFRVYLPISTETIPVKHEKVATPEENVGNSGTVLLIDDEETVRNITKTRLTRLGYAVIEAQDGVEAVRLFQEHQNEIDCILSDLTMPRMNGWETLKALRQKGADVPVILSSGYDKDTVMAGDHPELPQAFLNKPYSMAALKDVLLEVLRLS